MTPPNTPDITYEEFLEQALLIDCPCEECSPDLPYHTIEEAQRSLAYYREIWEYLTSNEPDYQPPLTSPSNQEMHALNGNIQVHDEGNIQAIERQLHEAENKILAGLQPGNRYIDHLPKRFRKNFDLGKLNFLYEALDAPELHDHHATIPPPPEKPTQKEIEEFAIALDPYMKVRLEARDQALKPSQLLKMKKITNKMQHAINGNQPSAWDYHHPAWEWKPSHPPPVNVMDGDASHDTALTFEHLESGDNPAQVLQASGPSNKDMHTYNGNINPIAGALEALARRGANKPKQQKKQKKKQTRPRPPPRRRRFWRPKAKTKAKALPKALKKEAKIDKLEDRVARRYNKFLYDPSIAPPRLGSTGSVPTKIVHGFYQRIVKMDSIDFGTNPTLGNATSMVAYINPRLFSQFNTVSDYASPIVLGFAATNSKTFDDLTGGAGFASMLCTDFTNSTSLKNEILGTSSTTQEHALARWLGGAVSVECRCPMSTTAPPFIFGGLLPENIAANSFDAVKLSTQLSTQTGAQLEQFLSSKEIRGFEGSSVYVPSSPSALLFNGWTSTNDGSTTSMPVTAIPYIAMNGCPTSATLVITVSSWFEIQQTKSNTYYSGWRLGPKVSSEDIFDRLHRRATVQPRLINQGIRSTSGPSATMQLMENIKMRETNAQPEPSIFDKMKELQNEIRQLRVMIDQEEDEKYFECEATPTLDKQDMLYSGLSKSTIDLAMSIKKSLTPGSVTSKTVQHIIQ